MTKRIELVPLKGKDLSRVLGEPNVFETKFTQRKLKNSQVRKKRKEWFASIEPPQKPAQLLTPLTAEKLTEKRLEGLRQIHESTTPTAEAIVNQKMDSDRIEGLLYSSLLAFNYVRMKSEYKDRLGRAQTSRQKAKVEASWAKIMDSAVLAYQVAGLNMSKKDVERQAKLLTKTKANFNAITEVANTAKSTDYGNGKLDLTTRPVSDLVTHVGKMDLGDIIGVFVPDLCERPFAEGVFTKHFSKTFSLSFTITIWCPTWTKPLRTCTKTFTLASLRFSADLEVGYRVNCCGASAWGSASAEVCGSIAGFTKCASCTATIVGVAGFSRAGSGSSCTYGLGINASLVCKFGSKTILNYSLPIGWNVTGPCPPPGLC